MALPLSAVLLSAVFAGTTPNVEAVTGLTPEQPLSASHSFSVGQSLSSSRSDEPPRVGFDVLNAFEHAKGKTLPKSVTRYHKQKVSISGFMERENPGNGPLEFFLIINDACGCTGLPKLTEMVFCATPAGKPTHLRPGLVTVTGTLYVKEQFEQGHLVAIYALDAESVNGVKLAPATK